MSLLAIDIGSGRCKAVVFRTSGECAAQSTKAYSPEFPRPAHAEMNPGKFWQAACEASCCATRDLAEDPVEALCFSSHGETFIPVDRDGKAIAPAILNMDNRAFSQAAWCQNKIGRKRLFEITGHISHSMYPLPKILWLREHRPDTFRSAAKFLSVTDYLLQRLGLPAYIDYSLASRFLLFDVRRQKWSDEVLSAAGLQEKLLPVPVPAGTVAGRLSAHSASELGVPAGTLVVVGGHDQACGALGAGVIERGRVSNSLGTYECVVAASDAPSLGESALAASLNSYCHVVPGKYVTLAYFPSGIMIDWFRELLCGPKAKTENSDEFYNALESLCPPGPSGLCVLPHLIGTCSPDFDPHARGAIWGLTPSTGRGHIYKGILEGLACELAQVCDALASAVGPFDGIYVAGGGARSQLGLLLRAALTKRRIHVLQCQESVCLGAAILAGVAAGAYRDISEAARQVVCESKAIEPDRGLFAIYAWQMEQYRMLYATLAPIRSFHARSSQERDIP